MLPIPPLSSPSQEGETPPTVPKDTQAVSAGTSDAAGQIASDKPYTLTDEAREAAIKHAGNLLVRFSNEGKRAMARHALTQMHALMAGRSPEWIAKRTAQIQQAIAASPGGEGCYFADAGNADREALASNEALPEKGGRLVSFDAIRWALQQDVGKSSTKFVLVAMAEFVNAENQVWVCWPSYRALAGITLQDSKTVEAAVYKLRELGFIVDTGKRKGETGKVIVYRLNDPNNGGVTPGPQPENANGTRPQNTPENGVIKANGNPPKFPPNPPKFPEQSPQISGSMTPKTVVGSSKGTRNGSRKEPEGAAAVAAIPGVQPQLLADWLAVRKAKRGGPLTETAVAALVREADKAGISVADAVRFCCEASWIGFNSSWYSERVSGGRTAARAAGDWTGNAT